MTLSERSENVAWELNELLAADRRARAFNEATVDGRESLERTGFKTMHWEQIGNEALERAILAERAAEEALANRTDTTEVATDETAEAPEPVNVEAELQARYEEGIEEGKRLTEAHQQTQRERHDELVEALAKHFATLPAVWPIVTDLALDIANTVCLRSLMFDPDVFQNYVMRALEHAELPDDLPVEIRLSEGTMPLVDADALAAKFPEHTMSVVLDSALTDGDISIVYDQVTVDRLLECEFDQLRDQLLAQFPDRNRPF